MITNQYSPGSICCQNCDSWDNYTIKENDTLYSISVKFGIPVKMLMACNRLLSPYNLQIGQVIKVPPARPTALGCMKDKETTYTIELNDTLYSIAEEYRCTVEDLLLMNPGIDPYNLKPGYKICVPKPDRKPESGMRPGVGIKPDSGINSLSDTESVTDMQSGADSTHSVMPLILSHHNTDENEGYAINRKCEGKTYTVQYGDTIEQILDINNLTYAGLAFNNPETDLGVLTPGTEICIPVQDIFGSCGSGTTYIIRRGDSLESISSRFEISVINIIRANPFMKPADFSVSGTKICIPE